MSEHDDSDNSDQVSAISTDDEVVEVENMFQVKQHALFLQFQKMSERVLGTLDEDALLGLLQWYYSHIYLPTIGE